MIEFYYLVKGAMIGFIVAAPVGPVSLLCIRRSLSKGRIQGFATGLGATIGDMFYASIAAFGLSFVINFLEREDFWLRLLGGSFLFFMGLYVFLKKRAAPSLDVDENVSHLGESFGSAFLLDISNPVVILAYIAIFSGFGLESAEQHLFSALSLVLGVTVGAAIWWFCLVQMICLFRKKITQRGVGLISKIAALVLLIFGLFIIYTSFYRVPFLDGTF